MKDYATASAVFRTPRGNPATMTYRLDTNDWNTTWSCLNEDEYALARLPELSGTALDIGAYTGGVTIALLIDNPGLRVTAVEPVPWNAALVRANADANGVGDRLTVIEAAVGEAPGTMHVHFGYEGTELAEHHAFVGNMSLVQGDSITDCPSDVPHLHAVVPTLTYADLVPPEGLAFVKIDCEGGEWGFLAGADGERIGRLHGEWHPTGGKTQADFTALLAGYDITYSGPVGGPQGFEAVLRG